MASGASKGLMGCGGCGCLFGLLAFLGGTVALVMGITNSSHMDEAILPGGAAAGLGIVIGIIGLVLLLIGLKMKKGAGEDEEEEE